MLHTCRVKGSTGWLLWRAGRLRDSARKDRLSGSERGMIDSGEKYKRGLE